MKDRRCEARVSPKHGGGKCSFAAKHRHDFELDGVPVTLHLCGSHFKVLVHRGHLGPESEYVRDWTRPEPL